MKVKILLFITLMITLLSSCYEDVLDTYDDSVVYKLRDRGPAGGWIFYINPNYREDGWRYLEAAPEDQTAGIVTWGPASAENGSDSSLPPALTGIGGGKKNTDWIKTIHKLNLSAYPAFKACIDYRGGGYSDWFLPSKDELWQMCWNLRGVDWIAGSMVQNSDVTSGGVGSFSSGTYWSSSEDYNSGNFAWFQDFSPDGSGFPGAQTSNSKFNFSHYVRAIRAF